MEAGFHTNILQGKKNDRLTLQEMKAQQKGMLIKQLNCTLYFKTNQVNYLH